MRHLMSPEMQERLAYQDYLQARANRTNMPIHRPYCGCVSSWNPAKCRRDSGCTFPEEASDE